jgi:hypothetical protein
MAFPATVDPLGRALLDVQTTARQLKTAAQGLKDASLAGNVSANAIISFYERLVAAKAKFTAGAAVPGIVQYARDQFDDQNLNVGAEFTAMNNAVESCRVWIAANLPTSTAPAAGYILKDQLTASGVTVRQFTTAQLAAFRTELDALVATIS